MLRPILLVEDNTKDLELSLMALELARLANKVVVVRDGREALDFLERKGSFVNRNDEPPAVVLLDLKLPKVDGLDVLKHIRNSDILKSVRVVMLTSSKEEHDVLRSYEIGVNAYVVKPIDFREFIDAIRNLGIFWAVVNEPPPN